MPVHPISITLMLAIALFFAGVFTIPFLRKTKTIRIVGYGAGLLCLMAGIAFSGMIHALHVGMSGDPADSSLLMGVVISLAIASPFFIVTWTRSRHLTPKPGHCPACGYDLRGNLNASSCPECGANVQ